MMHRRRVSRRPAGWDGTYHIVGDSAAVSRACRVIDISMLGLGITLKHFSPSELMGQRISVQVPSVGDSFSLRLEGVVKNAVPILGGAVRVGIAFNVFSESEPGTAAVQSVKRARRGQPSAHSNSLEV